MANRNQMQNRCTLSPPSKTNTVRVERFYINKYEIFYRRHTPPYYTHMSFYSIFFIAALFYFVRFHPIVHTPSIRFVFNEKSHRSRHPIIFGLTRRILERLVKKLQNCTVPIVISNLIQTQHAEIMVKGPQVLADACGNLCFEESKSHYRVHNMQRAVQNIRY